MPKLSARIQKAVGMGKTRADLMARTETINAAVDGCRVRYEQAGVKEFEYIAASDARTCEQCASHNGKIYKLTDNANLPPLHPNCRCAIAPIVGNRKKEIEEAAKKKPTTRPKPPISKTPQNEFKNTPPNKNTKEAMEAAKDWEELSNAMERRYGHVITLNSRLIKYSRFDDIKESILAADKMLDDIPAIAAQLTELGDFAGKKAYARAYPDKIEFGLKYRKSKTREELQASLNRDYNANFHPTNSIESIYIHELGHIAEAALIKKKNNGKFKIAEWTSSTRSADIIIEAAVNVERAKRNNPEWLPGNGSKMDKYILASWMLEDISRYATKNYSEALAEAFADYYCNGEEATDLSKEIIKIIKKELS